MFHTVLQTSPQVIFVFKRRLVNVNSSCAALWVRRVQTQTLLHFIFCLYIKSYFVKANSSSKFKDNTTRSKILSGSFWRHAELRFFSRNSWLPCSNEKNIRHFESIIFYCKSIEFHMNNFCIKPKSAGIKLNVWYLQPLKGRSLQGRTQNFWG